MNLLSEKDKEYIWHPFSPLDEKSEIPVIVSAKGVYLYTEDGRKIMDGISSWWVNIHGHSNDSIAKAVFDQASRLEHVIFAGFTHPPAIELAENLLKLLPIHQKKVFYSDNGSTAVEVGLKMAIQHWHNKGKKKKKIIAIQGAYHGDTFGSMSVGDRGSFVDPFSDFLFNVDYIDFPNSENREGVLAQFKRLAGDDDVAAFIFEPLLQGAAGMRTYDHSILDSLIDIAHKNDILCIADEVLTGFGRTGKFFASDYLKNKPDIFCLSKGLTGGTMALGVTTCSEKILEAFRIDDAKKIFFHGHSFTANPIACAASIASLKLLNTEESFSRIKMINECHLEASKFLQDHKKVADCRVLGTLLAIELKTDSGTSYFNSAREQLYNFFLQKDILLRPLGNIIYILPPYIITKQELNKIYEAIKELLEIY